MASSSNGGKSWSSVKQVSDDAHPFNQGSQDDQVRITSFPSLAIDPSSGTIAIVWADNEGAGSCGTGGSSFVGTTSNQVKLVTSSNGSVWSAPTRITSGPADKVYPSVGANAGRIVVGYYTREYSPLPTDTDRSCGITELDSATGLPVLPVDPARRNAPVCMDWAIKSSNDGFASQSRVSRESSNASAPRSTPPDARSRCGPIPAATRR